MVHKCRLLNIGYPVLIQICKLNILLNKWSELTPFASLIFITINIFFLKCIDHMLIPSFIHTQDIIYNIYIFGDLKKLVDGDVILSGVGKVQSIAVRKSWSPSYLSSRAIHNHKVHTVTVTQIIFTSFHQVSRSYTCHVHSSLLLQQTPADFLGRHDETHHIAENYFSDQYTILIRTSIVEAKC